MSAKRFTEWIITYEKSSKTLRVWLAIMFYTHCVMISLFLYIFLYKLLLKI